MNGPKTEHSRKSMRRVGWVVFALVSLIPCLTGIYLFLNTTPLSENIPGVVLFIVMLLAAGVIMINHFSSRLRYVARVVFLNTQANEVERIPVDETDVEELYTLTSAFNTLVETLESEKQASRKVTARMLAYINDLDKFEKRLREESLIRANLSRYVGEEVVEDLIRTEQFSFDNVECVATILFADIRSFTALSENMQPQETINMLNGYFSAMVPVIFKYGGTLDKFVGDQLMAVFRDNPYGERAPFRAVSAALEMRHEVNMLNKQGGKYANLDIGVGINTGSVVIGNVGSEHRKDYTVIGDTVNVAARFEQMASPNEIIVGRPTWEICRDRVPMQKIGEITLKNRQNPVQAYRVISAGGQEVPEVKSSAG